MAKQLSEVKTNAVDDLVAGLQHPLQEEIANLRSIIKGADSRIKERIKWNAPSYYLSLSSTGVSKSRELDFLTIHIKNTSLVHLIFHHPAIVLIESPLLEGDYKDRRMTYLKDRAAIKKNKEEIVHIIQRLLKLLEDNGVNAR